MLTLHFCLCGISAVLSPHLGSIVHGHGKPEENVLFFSFSACLRHLLTNFATQKY